MKNNEFAVHVVDPDQAIAEGLATLLNTYGIEVFSYPNAEAFLEAAPRLHPEQCCVLVEADLPGLSGPALLQKILGERPDLHVLLLVSTALPDLIKVARMNSSIGVIEKPCLDGMLVDRILRLRECA